MSKTHLLRLSSTGVALAKKKQDSGSFPTTKLGGWISSARVQKHALHRPRIRRANLQKKI
jgi:hypothetical protein